MASIYCRHGTAPETLNAIAHAVQESSGTAYLADTAFPDDDSARLTALFDRSADYAELMKSIEPIQAALSLIRRWMR